jgi:hypothetical protein
MRSLNVDVRPFNSGMPQGDSAKNSDARFEPS